MQVPLAAHLEGRRRHAIEIEEQVAIAIDHVVATRWPVLRQAHVVQLVEDTVHVRADFRLRVTPNRDQAVGLQHATRFSAEARGIEPMIGLSDSDQVRGPIWQAGLLSSPYKVPDPSVRQSAGNLLFARITRVDRIKIPSQRHTRLPVPAPRIPGQLVPMRLRRQPGKKVFGIARSGIGISGGVAGEMVLERHGEGLKRVPRATAPAQDHPADRGRWRCAPGARSAGRPRPSCAAPGGCGLRGWSVR